MIAGARERIVTKNKIIRERLVSFGFLASFTLKLRFGIGILVLVLCAYNSAPIPRIKTARKLTKINFISGFRDNRYVTQRFKTLERNFFCPHSFIMSHTLLGKMIVGFSLTSERSVLSCFNFSNLSNWRNLISSMISSSLVSLSL